MSAGPGEILTGRIEDDNVWVGRTPGGTYYAMSVRPNTSDWNTIQAGSWAHDEYQLPQGTVGWALDVGGHIGSVCVPLLIDNPELRCVVIEALPENVALLRTNAVRNHVDDRLTIVMGAASDTPEPVRIGYGELIDPTLIHQYIGSAAAADGGSAYVEATGVTLRGVMLLRGPAQDEPWAWAKLDCEGCEYPFLSSPYVTSLLFITGEVHHGWQRLLDILEPTHRVYGPGKDFGPFTAVLREP